MEFSLLYRWHSLVPSTMKWGGQDRPIASLLMNNRLLTDGGLAAAFADVSANNATELGLGNSDPIFVSVASKAEVKAVEQGRSSNLASYNDYRRAMGRDPAASFEAIVGKSKDPVEKARRAALVARLQALYGNVDNLEYYVGNLRRASLGKRSAPVADLGDGGDGRLFAGLHHSSAQ